MLNFCKMVKALIVSLLRYKDFSDPEDFWDWYWNQIPDERYASETLADSLSTFFWVISFGVLRDEISTAWNNHFGKHYPGFSTYHNKKGYYFKSGGLWLFVPDDKSFQYSVPSREEVKANVGFC